MLVTGFKKAVLVLSIVVLTVPAAWAASSALVGGGARKGDASFEREIEGGIKITLQGISQKGNYVCIRYVALSEEDTVIKVEAGKDNAAIFDDRGNQFSSYNCGVWTEIGNLRTKEREIIAGVPTDVLVGYQAGEKYKMPAKFSRAAININGKKLVFRDVPAKQ
jgi:hypothetical protein